MDWLTFAVIKTMTLTNKTMMPYHNYEIPGTKYITILVVKAVLVFSALCASIVYFIW